MRRRNFIKLAAMAAVAAVLPKTVPARLPTPVPTPSAPTWFDIPIIANDSAYLDNRIVFFNSAGWPSAPQKVIGARRA